MAKTGSKHTDLTDEELSRMALEGEYDRATSILYAKYAIIIRAYLSRYIKDEFELDDVVQETFMKAFRQLDKFDAGKRKGAKSSPDSMRSWLFEIAKNTSLDHKEKNDRNLPPASQASTSASADDRDSSGEIATMSPEDELIIEQRKELIDRVINGLPDLYRDIARMCLIDCLGYQEISEKLGIPLNTVKTRIRRAKMMITEIVGNEEDS